MIQRLLIIMVALSMLIMSTKAQEATTCGVEPGYSFDISWDEDGMLEIDDLVWNATIRTVYSNQDEDVVWVGTSLGEILALDVTTSQLHFCLDNQEDATPINDFVHWRGSLFVATDGLGVYEWDYQEWTLHNPNNNMAEEFNDTYDLVINPWSQNLVIATRGGVFEFDGQDWSDFAYMPPDGIRNFHRIEFSFVGESYGEYEVVMGSITNGTYRWLSGQWERFGEQGIQHWHPIHGWYEKWEFASMQFPVNVRDIAQVPRIAIIRLQAEYPFQIGSEEKAENGDEYFARTWAIVGDCTEGSCIALLTTGNGVDPESYYAEIPQSGDRRFTHLTSVTPISPESFFVTNFSDEEGGGTFLWWGNEIEKWVNYPSYDVTFTGGAMYTATADGLHKTGGIEASGE